MFAAVDIAESELFVIADIDWLDALQWVALIITVIAAWLVGSQRQRRRETGFILFLLCNVVWGGGGWHAQAYAVLALQFFLAISNVRGIIKTRQGGKPLPVR